MKFHKIPEHSDSIKCREPNVKTKFAVVVLKRTNTGNWYLHLYNLISLISSNQEDPSSNQEGPEQRVQVDGPIFFVQIPLSINEHGPGFRPIQITNIALPRSSCTGLYRIKMGVFIYKIYILCYTITQESSSSSCWSQRTSPPFEVFWTS
jgi:hypothetical protein